MDWFTLAIGIVTGSASLKIIEQSIAFVREHREQQERKLSQEKDRPRFRVDVAITKSIGYAVPTAIVKILSLGSLPLTINQGEIFIEADHYPEHVQPKKLNGREIGPIHPIEV